MDLLSLHKNTPLCSVPVSRWAKSLETGRNLDWPRYHHRLPQWLSGKESACSAGDAGSIPGSGRCPGEGNGSPLQSSCLESPMDSGAWPATVWGGKGLDTHEWLNSNRDDRTKRSQKQRQVLYGVTFMWNLNMTQMNLSMKQKQDHSRGEQTGGCKGGWGGRGAVWEGEVHRCRPLYMGWIHSKVLLYSTGDYGQYPMINHSVKEHLKS